MIVRILPTLFTALAYITKRVNASKKKKKAAERTSAARGRKTAQKAAERTSAAQARKTAQKTTRSPASRRKTAKR